MFLETICIANGIVQDIEAHRERMRETASHFGFRAPQLPDLVARLSTELRNKRVKCSVTYHEHILGIAFAEYQQREIHSLKLIETEQLDYAFKYSDRSALHALLQKRGDCDEILIVQDGHITDTSFSNVIFRKGGAYFTPCTCLLDGIKRQRLLRAGRIREAEITVSDLHLFETVHLINAMLDIEDGVTLPVANIAR